MRRLESLGPLRLDHQSKWESRCLVLEMKGKAREGYSSTSGLRVRTRGGCCEHVISQAPTTTGKDPCSNSELRVIIMLHHFELKFPYL